MEIKFVGFIPEEIEDNVLYFSPEFSTAVHLCMCGCQNKVVTPFAKSEWKLTFAGSFSLHPSIGNWNFPCRSHYWIRNGKAIHCETNKEMTSIIDRHSVNDKNNVARTSGFFKWIKSLRDLIVKFF